MKKKIVTVIGARPQFIKAAAVSRVLAADTDIEEVIVHTGQHFDHNMSQVFFDQMGVPVPAYNLNIHGLSHGAMTGAMLTGIEEVLVKEKPDFVMVYGDTNSTLAGALAAAKLHIPLAHVEAGLRSYNMHMPEEINRILTDRISTLLFCPTRTAIRNLVKEGFESFACEIVLTGDVMYDAMRIFKEYASAPDGIELPERFALATIHRAENTDNMDRFRELTDALSEIATRMPVVFPVHPRTKKLMHDSGITIQSPDVVITSAMGYLEMLYLLDHCDMVVTDSGGVQKEAYFFEKPCITLRDETEWTELVAGGYNRICGSSKEKILAAFDYFSAARIEFIPGLYGDGQAATIIAKTLTDR